MEASVRFGGGKEIVNRSPKLSQPFFHKQSKRTSHARIQQKQHKCTLDKNILKFILEPKKLTRDSRSQKSKYKGTGVDVENNLT